MKNEILISAQGVSRIYGQKIAVDNISFNVHRGEILGFLGPNGAGKSTTMQIIAGVLSASRGAVSIANHDIQTDYRRAKQHIGFLPEQLPLYNDLSVDEYLYYVARLRQVNRQEVNEAVRLAKQHCGLDNVGERLLQNLSRGYRQRVGIAQAIVHSPSVIILDEPTNGLDPIQINEIRGLIKELGKDHSVILSTHILPEAQDISDRVLIIHQGKIVLDQDMKELQKKSQHPDNMTVTLRQIPVLESLLKIDGVISAVKSGENTLKINLEPKSNAFDSIIRKAVTEQWGLTELNTDQSSLENIFIQLTYGDQQKEQVRHD